MTTPSDITHYPHRNGPVCGLSPPPTYARLYTVDNPTCPKCAQWINAVRASGQAESAAAASAKPTPKPPKGDDK